MFSFRLFFPLIYHLYVCACLYECTVCCLLNSMCVYRCGMHMHVCISTWKMRICIYVYVNEWTVMFSASEANLNWTLKVWRIWVCMNVCCVCERACMCLSVYPRSHIGWWVPDVSTLRGCLAPRLRPPIWKQLGTVTSACYGSFSLCFSTCTHVHTHPKCIHTHIFTEHARSLVLSFFSPCCSFSYPFIAHTHYTRSLLESCVSTQHSTLFHASPRMTDSKQHFLPFFFHGKNSCPYITLHSGSLLVLLFFSLSVSLSLTSLSSPSISHASG